jgi:phosphinothricin acetyltransferase
MPLEIEIRSATLDDAHAIAEIYNHYVLDTTATFDMTPKSPQDRATWLTKRDIDHPVLVAQVGDRIVGWGSLSPWAERPAWRHTVEIAAYVELAWRNQGIGSRLMETLLEHAVRAGHHAVIAQIVSENAASLQLAEHVGFKEVGRLKEVGRKFDRWLDVVLMERVL